MQGSRFYKAPEFETIQLHGGQNLDKDTRARALPIYSTTSFCFKDFEQATQIFQGNDPSFVYTRVGNPTTAVFEERMAQLEGGLAAVASATGISAQFIAIGALARVGDNFISASQLFGGTVYQFQATFDKYGIGVKFVSSTKPEDFAAAIDDKTKAIFVESIGNPNCVVHDLEKLAKVAHDHGIPLIVDNTFGMGGYLVRPFDHGADIIVHSATKWIGGHGTGMGGVVIDSGRFDWRNSGRFPHLTTPDRNGVVPCDKFGSKVYTVKLRHETRDVGPCMHPFGAFLMIQGLETLSLRSERHSSNSMALARWLENHPKVAWVSYPGLESHPSHELAKKYMRPGIFGGMLNFGIKGSDMNIIGKFINNLRLSSHLANVGDAKTLVIHPASTTHCMLTKEEQVAAEVHPDLIRVSTGLEAIDDIIADFDGALAATFAT